MRSGSQIKKTASRSRAYLRATYDLLSEKIMVGSFCFTKESVKLGNSSKKAYAFPGLSLFQNRHD